MVYFSIGLICDLLYIYINRILGNHGQYFLGNRKTICSDDADDDNYYFISDEKEIW